MYHKDKRSFFEKLTGTVNIDEDDFLEEEQEQEQHAIHHGAPGPQQVETEGNWEDDDEGAEDGELTVDVYHTDDEIIIQAMIAGVNPKDIDIQITREMVTIRGKRVAPSDIADDSYYHKELYWGSFSRRILLPEEVEAEESEAIEKHGLLMLKLPKIDKKKTANVKVKSA
jgi:HSP20 family protein